jgi:hypothetical protein
VRNRLRNRLRESVLFIGTQFSILYTFMYSPAEAAGTVGKFSRSTAISTEVAGGTGERSAVCVYVCVCVCVCVCLLIHLPLHFVQFLSVSCDAL